MCSLVIVDQFCLLPLVCLRTFDAPMIMIMIDAPMNFEGFLLMESCELCVSSVLKIILKNK